MPQRRVLLAHAAEHPAVVPAAAVAVDVHARSAADAKERGETELVVLVAPLGAVRLGVGELGVLLVEGGLGDRVGLEAVEGELGLQCLAADHAVHDRLGAGTEEVEVHLLDALGLRTRHGIHHRAGDVLLAPRGVESLLGCTGAVHLHLTDDEARDGLEAGAEWGEKLHPQVLEPENLLGCLGGEFGAVFARGRTELVDQHVELAIGHQWMFRCDHGLRHGVISLPFQVAGWGPAGRGITALPVLGSIISHL